MLARDVVLITASQADLGGPGRRSLARAAEAGRMRRMLRGVYVALEDWAALDERQRQILYLYAVQRASDRPLVFSHWSAALVLDLPVPYASYGQPCITVAPGSNRDLSGVRARALHLADGDVVEADGLLVTTWARTVVDIIDASGFLQGVTVADAALHRLQPHDRVAGKHVLFEAWDRAQPRRSTVVVPDAIGFSDGASESPNESRSRVTMRVLRVAPPILQRDFFDDQGFIGRGDFYFEEEDAIGEADGRVKILDPDMNRGEPARVVLDEKRREDRMRATHRGFGRWEWEVSGSPQRLAAVLARMGVHPRRTVVRI